VWGWYGVFVVARIGNVCIGSGGGGGSLQLCNCYDRRRVMISMYDALVIPVKSSSCRS
jgi:hypothetical protein